MLNLVFCRPRPDQNVSFSLLLFFSFFLSEVGFGEATTMRGVLGKLGKGLTLFMGSGAR